MKLVKVSTLLFLAALSLPSAGAAEKSVKVKSVKVKSVAKPGPARLIPPPPPTIPVTGQYGPIGGYDIEFMSLPDLKSRQAELGDDIKQARRQNEDQQARCKEQSKKALLFVDLFKEGVVSRRELETTQDEARRLEQDSQDSQRKLANLEAEMKRLETRLKKLAPPVAAKSKTVSKAKESK